MTGPFLDTYAILAILDGAASYRGILTRPAVAHQMNLLEAAYVLHRREIEEPLTHLRRLRLGLVEATETDLDAAARLKLELARARRNVSLVDALGYALALRIGQPFLTGDRAFQGLPGVEFLVAA